MSKLYTEYVAQLRDDGTQPDPEIVGRVLDQLQKHLVYRMKRRGLLQASPTFLGIIGSSWWDGTSLEELVHDCYSYVFVSRLKGLRTKVAHGGDIGGLVLQYLDQLLSDRQRRADPIGARVFHVLRAALLLMIEDGELCLLDGDPQIRNDTMLGFDAQTEQVAKAAELAERVVAWNDQLLPGLVTAIGGAVPKVEQLLVSLITGLRDSGILAFRFKDLIDPLKNDARLRWLGTWRASLGELAVEGGDAEEQPRLVRVEPPFNPVDHVGELHVCVTTSIDTLPARRRTREYLRLLWMYLRGIAVGKEDEPDGDRPRPPDVRLSEHLEIPRGRIPGLLETLRGLVTACRSGRERSADQEDQP